MTATAERTNGERGSVATLRPPKADTNGTNVPEAASPDQAPARPHVAARAELATIERSAVGVVQAQRAEVRGALAGVIFGAKNVTVERAGAGQIMAAGAVNLSQAAARSVIAGGDATVSQAGAGLLVALGDMQIQQGGGCGLVARNATVGRGGFVGLAVTPRLEVADGGRVLSTRAFVAGAMAGIGAGVVLGGQIRRARR